MPAPKKISVAPYLDSWRDALLGALGGRIREIRTLRGLTITGFTEQLGTSLSQYSRIEHGKSNIRMRWLERIAHGLGVEPWELLVPIDKSDVLRAGTARGGKRRREVAPLIVPQEGPLQAMVGTRIRELRELQGLSLLALADLTDINVRQISHLEQGRMNSALVTVDRVARGLRVDLHELFVPVEKSDVLGPSARAKPRRTGGAREAP